MTFFTLKQPEGITHPKFCKNPKGYAPLLKEYNAVMSQVDRLMALYPEYDERLTQFTSLYKKNILDSVNSRAERVCYSQELKTQLYNLTYWINESNNQADYATPEDLTVLTAVAAITGVPGGSLIVVGALAVVAHPFGAFVAGSILLAMGLAAVGILIKAIIDLVNYNMPGIEKITEIIKHPVELPAIDVDREALVSASLV